MRLEYTPYTLDFKFQAKTSQGSMTDRRVWFVKVYDESGFFGLGEVAPIDRLSPEDVEDVPEELNRIQSMILSFQAPTTEEEVWTMVQKLVTIDFPSIRFGLEVAFFDLLNGGEKKIFRNDLTRVSIPINGLVWMGEVNFMKEQIKEKLDAGFNCIKLKVGALDFEAELAVIRELRSVSDNLVIRLDANGAFKVNEVLTRLKALTPFNIHSIEQPILPDQPEAMEIVCKKSQIPIALDEELVWVRNEQEKLKLLQEIKPHYLVLKPTIHGGFESVKNWIDLAEIQGVEWWITSYLESNIGLNAIAQFVSLYENSEYHGLGTGSLYHNNIISPIIINKGYFQYAQSSNWGEVGI